MIIIMINTVIIISQAAAVACGAFAPGGMGLVQAKEDSADAPDYLVRRCVNVFQSKAGRPDASNCCPVFFAHLMHAVRLPKEHHECDGALKERRHKVCALCNGALVTSLLAISPRR